MLRKSHGFFLERGLFFSIRVTSFTEQHLSVSGAALGRSFYLFIFPLECGKTEPDLMTSLAMLYRTEVVKPDMKCEVNFSLFCTCTVGLESELGESQESCHPEDVGRLHSGRKQIQHWLADGGRAHELSQLNSKIDKALLWKNHWKLLLERKCCQKWVSREPPSCRFLFLLQKWLRVYVGGRAQRICWQDGEIIIIKKIQNKQKTPPILCVQAVV